MIRILLLCTLGSFYALSTCCGKVYSTEHYIGFTSQNYLPQLSVSLESVRYLLESDELSGFDWMELRDPDASLSLKDCETLAALAQSQSRGILYSVQRGILDEDLIAVAEKAVTRINLFDGPNYLRVLALKTGDNPWWTLDEFETVLRRASSLQKIASESGIQIMIENADVIPFGDGTESFGLADLLRETPDSFRLQLDTGNFFLGAQKRPVDEVLNFIHEFLNRIDYVHLKPVKEETVQAQLDQNPIPFETWFSILETAEPKRSLWLAFELNTNGIPLQETHTKHQVSRNNLLRILPSNYDKQDPR